MKEVKKRLANERPRAKRMPASARRQQILLCAIAVFSETGMVNAKHTDVAEKAQVSIPTVFHYFPTIEALQSGVLKELHRYFMEQLIMPQMSSDRPAYERIEAILLAFHQAIDANHGYVTVWLEWSGFTRGHTWDLYLEFYQEASNAIRKILLAGRKDSSICSDINAVDASRVIMGMAHTIAHMRYSGSSQRVIEKTVHSLVMSYLAPH